MTGKCVAQAYARFHVMSVLHNIAVPHPKSSLSSIHRWAFAPRTTCPGRGTVCLVSERIFFHL
jgi:hypothetical protein